MRGSSAPPVVVAITGASMRFAGGVDGHSALHAALCEVRELHSPMPFTRFVADVFFAPGVWLPFLYNTNHAIFVVLSCGLPAVGCGLCMLCAVCCMLCLLQCVVCVCVCRNTMHSIHQL